MKEKILELRSLGYSYKQIQDKLGCSKGTIAYHVGIGQKDKTSKRRKDGRNKIRKLIQESKHNKKCIDCGESYPYWIMEFDHLSNKKFNISTFQSYTNSLEVVKEEIDKCDIVCANCHKNRTFQRLIKTCDDVLIDSDLM